LYSVAALTNNVGVVVERYRYDAYGQRTVLAADGTTVRAQSNYGQQIGFTGRYLDKETGLWYFRARYFDPALGRFIGRDPAGYVDRYQLYMAYFVPNKLDPTGKTCGECKKGQCKGEFTGFTEETMVEIQGLEPVDLLDLIAEVDPTRVTTVLSSADNAINTINVYIKVTLDYEITYCNTCCCTWWYFWCEKYAWDKKPKKEKKIKKHRNRIGYFDKSGGG